MARTKRVNKYCIDCGSRLTYYANLSNPKAPNEHRVLTYGCIDCSTDWDKPKLFSIKRFEDEKTLEAVSVEIHQTRKKLNQEKICSPKVRAKKARLEAIYKKDNPGNEY